MLGGIHLAFKDGFARRDTGELVNIFSTAPALKPQNVAPALYETGMNKGNNRKNKKAEFSSPVQKEDSPATSQSTRSPPPTESTKSKRQEKKERKKTEWDAKCRARENESRSIAEKEGKLKEFAEEVQRKEEEKAKRTSGATQKNRTEVQQPRLAQNSSPEKQANVQTKPGPDTVAGDAGSAPVADAEVDFLISKKKRQRERELIGSGPTPSAKRKRKFGEPDSFPLLDNTPLVQSSNPPKSSPNPVASPSSLPQSNLPHKAQLRAQSHALLKQRELLPIWEHQNDLRQALREKNILVMLGETGSGKSTQIGQFLVSEPWMKKQRINDSRTGREVLVGGCIAITQPRRVAAVNLARRVAQEMGVHLGDDVGYAVRFDSKSSIEKTRIKFLTDGMLLQELLHDPLLKRYSAVVVDEAHERTIGTDLAMGFLRGLVYGARGGEKGLKLIVMSATIEVERMARFFEKEKDILEEAAVDREGDRFMANGVDEVLEKSSSASEEEFTGCHIDSDEDKEVTDDSEKEDSSTVVKFQVPGRQFPIELYHAPESVTDYVDAALRTVFQIHYGEPMPGDILVFLTGQDEIEALQKLIEEYAQGMDKNVPKVELPPLIDFLSIRVFNSSSRYRCASYHCMQPFPSHYSKRFSSVPRSVTCARSSSRPISPRPL